MREERPFEHGDTIHPIYIEICVSVHGVRVYTKKRSYPIRERRREGTRRDLSKTGEDRSTRPSKDRLLSSKSEQTRGYSNLFSLSLTVSIYLSSCSPRCDVPSLNCTHNGNALVERHTSLLSPSNVFYNMTERIVSI